MVLSRIRFRVSCGFFGGECCASDTAVCVAGGDDQFLVFAVGSYVVAPIRIRSGCLRACDNGRGATAHSSTAQTDRKKPEQPHATPALQRFLLLTPDPARTGTRAANGGLAQGFFGRAGASPAVPATGAVALQTSALDTSAATTCGVLSMSRIIVVGAGINGVTAAIEINKRGHEVVLIDPGPLPHPLAASTD